MDNIVNKEIDKWVRPWNKESFDYINIKDDRYFALLIKSLLFFLNENIVLYNKSVNHFIYNTGSSYLYIENNGYEFKLNETSNDNMIYMELPRCIIEIDNINYSNDELSNPFSIGSYERMDKNNNINGYSAEIRRLPIELSINLKYVLSTFNESIILVEEILNKLVYQKYFKFIFLGKEVACSIELPESQKININKIDMTSKDQSTKTIELSVKLCSNYPIINERTEIPINNIINGFELNTGFGDENYNTDNTQKNIN